MDVTLKLLPNLLMSDLNNLSKNKNVSDTIRKIALKMYRFFVQTLAKRLRATSENLARAHSGAA